MKLEEMLAEMAEWDQEREEEATEKGQKLVTELEKMGFSAADGWEVKPVVKKWGDHGLTPCVLVAHNSLPHTVEIMKDGGTLRAQVPGDDERYRHIGGQTDLLRVLRYGIPALEEQEWKPRDSIERKATEVVEKLRKARLLWTDEVSRVALLEGIVATSKAVAEDKAAKAAGGEKELGTNEAARTRALTLAVARDEAYQKPAMTLLEAQGEERRAKVEVDSLEDELKVLLAAMRREKEEE